ncbi:MAG: J domain-containing protein [Alphaproteobacteria bacterium]|nr:J domain-containing protein [Alphaproteobacteria bacterium]MCK5623474.1 J domain-containing protein [Alphaproteobacteria bacterium]
MKDPYELLGVARDASQADIKKAYRALAKKLHPDVNPGDESVEQHFKEITAAYDMLSDEERRRKFDSGMIDADGTAQNPFHRHYRKDAAGGFDFGGGGIDIDDLFSDLFGRGKRGQARQQHRARKPKGQDLTYTTTVSFLDAMRGGRQRVSLYSGKTLDVNLPPGTEDGQRLRMKGQGMPGPAGGVAGDAFVEVHVEPHPFMRREGLDIHLDLPVTLHEAVLGGKVKVPTIDGAVNATVPSGSSGGTVLRLKGRGIMTPKGGRRGDQFVKLRIVLPEAGGEELAEFLKEWNPLDYDPRKKLKLD